jgi:MSHA pilin protein MshD
VKPPSQRGVALIEVIVAIVLISAMAAVVLGETSASAKASASYLVASEAAAVADAYVGLIAGRAFVDPDGVDGEAMRAAFDDVDDYDGLHDVGARDATGAVIAGLTALDVRVRVTPSSLLPGVASSDALRVDVTVLDRDGQPHLATAYRLRP